MSVTRKNRQVQAHISTCAQQRTYQNSTLNVAYFSDKIVKRLVASENIELIATSYNPDENPNEPWKLTSTRIDSIKENAAVRAQISNGKPGKKVFFQLTGNGLDKNDLDLSYGRMKGKANMDQDGYAVIPFMIRADQKTEGTETFKFSFFKDKKCNKNILPLA